MTDKLCTLCMHTRKETPATNQLGKYGPLCDACYEDAMEARESGGYVSGADEQGHSIDPYHPWNKEKRKGTH